MNAAGRRARLVVEKRQLILVADRVVVLLSVLLPWQPHTPVVQRTIETLMPIPRAPCEACQAH